ncbi:MAG: class I SAM-dependent methyltransferase, partial [Candidatus Omnitrophica bacterium]|nr:class I SAM-dependent methyltransferase [Candidatus Omnitrophota bacterium]
MKHKLMKFISLIVAVTFVWQQSGRAEYNFLRPAAYSERGDAIPQRKPNINSFKDIQELKEALRKVLDQKGLQALDEGQLELLARRLIERRKGFFGYPSQERLRGQLHHIGIRGLTKAHQAAICDGFDYSMTRRQASVVIGSGVGVLAAVAATVSALLVGRADEPGEVTWVFTGHASAWDAVWTVEELRRTEGAAKRFLILEMGPPSLADIGRNYPAVTNMIDREAVQKLLGMLEDEHRDEEWVRVNSDLGRKLIEILENEQKKDQEGRKKFMDIMKSKNISDREILESGLFMAPIGKYLSEHSDVAVIDERPTLRAFLYNILYGLFDTDALIALFVDRDEVRCAQSKALSFAAMDACIEVRDSFFNGGLLSPFFADTQNAGARAVIQRGASHADIAEKVKYGAFKKRKIHRGLPLSPLREIFYQHKRHIVGPRGNVNGAMLLEKGRKELLTDFVINAVGNSFSKEQVGANKIVEMATSVAERLTLDDINELVSFLRDRGKVIFFKGSKDYLAINRLDLYIIAWLNSKGKIPPDVKIYMEEKRSNISVEKVDSILNEALRKGIKAIEGSILRPLAKGEKQPPAAAKDRGRKTRDENEVTKKIGEIERLYKKWEYAREIAYFIKTSAGGAYGSSDAKDVEAICRYFLADRDDADILDLGSGTGKAVAVFSHFARSVTGIDIVANLNNQAVWCMGQLDGMSLLGAGSIELKVGNFLAGDFPFSRYHLIYIYFPHVLTNLGGQEMAMYLEEIILAEMGSDAVFVLNYPGEPEDFGKAFSKLTRLNIPYKDGHGGGIFTKEIKAYKVPQSQLPQSAARGATAVPGNATLKNIDQADYSSILRPLALREKNGNSLPAGIRGVGAG